MPVPDPIVSLEHSQIARAADIICQAFADDPAGVYAAPDPKKRSHLLSWYARISLVLGFSQGKIFTNSLLTGVAVWLPPGSNEITLTALLQAGILPPLKAGPASLWRFVKAMIHFSQVQSRYVTELHWYLFILTVLPSCQGQGLGGKLLQPILDHADAAGLPCYLDTANPKAIPFYEKQGFKILYQDYFPGSSIPFWGVRRKPK